MKYALFALVAMLLLAGCTSEVALKAQENITAGQVSDGELPGLDDQVLNDTAAIVEANISIEVKNDTVIVDVRNVTANYTVTAKLEEWCKPGEIFAQDAENSSVEATMKSITTYKGNKVCEAESTTTIESPVGTIETVTTYYISEDVSEMWAIVNTMGQTQEVYTKLK